jgi:uncharacterized glyoxalase superfamily protein PhnB
MTFRSIAPVFAVHDVESTMWWYHVVLGFVPHPFPERPPHAFCVLENGAVEIMLQRLDGYVKPELYGTRAGGVWDIYVRMEGVSELYRVLKRRGDITFLEPLTKQPYGDTEFVIKDPNGYVLVFSELITSPA